MSGHFPEESDILLGLLQASGAGGVDGDIVYAGDCDEIGALITLGVGTGANASNQATIVVKAQSSNAGAGVTVLSFDRYFIKTGDTTLAAGGSPLGAWTRVDLTTAVASLQTAAADADNQQQIYIPIRTRALPQGLNWFSAHITALVAARVVGIQYIRHNNAYQPSVNKALY